jgi:4-diphosphocytidyl-2-C-methyl-D-erythritol kinase
MPAPAALYDLMAPAKVNLFLHITGRRHDGYHLLQTALCLIDWADTLHVERTQGGALTRTDLHPADAELPHDDLCIRAARALQAATGCTMGAHITLNKQLPTQAGLGGGSSDAATVLVALNHLWGCRLSRAELQLLALPLGADVPFFVTGWGAALARGVGELLSPLDLPAADVLLLKPPVGLSTPAVFKHPACQRDTDPAILEGFVADAQTPALQAPERWQRMWMWGRNDLQTAAVAIEPQVGQALQQLQHAGWSGARLSGSGSAVFAPAAPGSRALARSGSIPPGARWSSTLPAHPLLAL